jgi:hypothetical protein
MATYAHTDVLDNGIAYIKANSNKVLAVLAYTAGDSYAAVAAAANVIAEVVLVPADFALSGTAARSLTLATGKQDASANNSGDPTHIVFVDTVSAKVLWATPETGAIVVSAGQPVTFPASVYTSSQPA